MKNKIKIFLIIARVIFATFIISLVGLILAAMLVKTPNAEIELPGITGMLIIISVVLNAIMFAGMFILQVIKGIKEKGLKFITTEIIRVVVMFVVLVILGKVLKSGETIEHWIFMAVGIEVVSVAIDYWRYLKEKAKSNEK